MDPVNSAPSPAPRKEAGKYQDRQVYRCHVGDGPDESEDGSGHRHATSAALIGNRPEIGRENMVARDPIVTARPAVMAFAPQSLVGIGRG